MNVSITPEWVSVRATGASRLKYCVELETGPAYAIVWLTHEQFCELRDRITTTLATIEYAPKEEP